MTEWKPSYCVGNELLDRQHRKLLDLCNAAEVLASDNSSVNDEKFHDVLNELMKYVSEHFSTEEAMLTQINYTGLAAQKAEHAEFLEQLTQFLMEATLGLIDKPGVSKFLLDWWMGHILGTDMQYKTHLA